MKNIIIIGHEPLTKKNKSNFFIDKYLEKDYQLHTGMLHKYFIQACI